MLIQDTFDGLAIKSALIPKTVGFFLNLFGIEFSQYFFQFKHHLFAFAMVEHFEQVQLNWIQCGLFGVHGFLVCLNIISQKYKIETLSAR